MLEFDDITLDLAGRRLLRAGELQPLEPKAFAVLCLLARAPGQVFSRDEILDAVWGHRHITPGVLNRIITLLRHALGEDAHHPRYLHTVHGYGYRFDRPLAAATPTAPVRDDPAEATADSADASRAPGDDVGAADGAPPARRRAWPWALSAVLALAVGGLGWSWWASRDTPPPPPASAPGSAAAPVLAVLPLRALGDDPRSLAFADGLSEELAGLLAHIDGLRVTSRTSAFRFRDAGLPVSDIARRLQATHVLEGSVRQDGERLRINLRLIEAGTDRTLWAQDFDRELRDIFELQRNIGYAIANALQLQLGLSPSSARADEDPALYRQYLLIRYSQRGEKSTTPALMTAEKELREMLREHPDYARAWGALAAILSQRATAPMPGRDELRAQAEQAAARALQLDPDQSDAHTVLAERACRAQRWDECMALSRRSLVLAPSDVVVRGTHAWRLATMGYIDEAQREIDAALAIAPFDPIIHFWRGRVLDTLGRHEEARRHLVLGDPGLSVTGLFFNAVWRGDYDDAERIASSLPADMPWRASELAAVAALRDPSRWPAVLPLIEQAERGSQYGQVPYDFTRLLLPRRDYARDIAGLDAVQRSGYASYQWVFWQPESRELRRDPAFAQYLQRSGLLAYWREHGFPAQCRAEGDGARCD
ncbi:winged helix-turn-helix domain-containing protein [Lysobacter sp. FW306-1B-D06B]|uniref:winged helix-turn-helix domain-containing protein n=1 Tax=Lysobacter sp. FW306-1B-D06B TaxID=3140250 RepID=UPI003140A860